jgi:hypothetical protein
VSFSWDKFLKKFGQAEEQAKKASGPLTVRAKPLAQAGSTVLVGKCPVRHCGEVAALSGEGRHMCRRCGAWLRYVREG